MKKTATNRVLFPVLIALLAVLLLAAWLVPDVLAKSNTDKWLARCESAYSELVAGYAYHYTLTVTGQDSSHREVWSYGKDSLQICGSGKARSYTLQKGSRLYTRSDPDSPWTGGGDIMMDYVTLSDNWSDCGYRFVGIDASVFGTKVIYRKDTTGGSSRTLAFRFDSIGRLTGITVEQTVYSDAEDGTTRIEYQKAFKYTFFDTSAADISDTIDLFYTEAAAEAKSAD